MLFLCGFILGILLGCILVTRHWVWCANNNKVIPWWNDTFFRVVKGKKQTRPVTEWLLVNEKEPLYPPWDITW